MEAGSHRLTTTVHAHESKAVISSGKYPKNSTSIQRMGTNTTTVKPKRHGYICRKDKRTSHGKRRNEPSNDATRRIHPSRRIPPMRTRRRETERLT